MKIEVIESGCLFSEKIKKLALEIRGKNDSLKA